MWMPLGKKKLFITLTFTLLFSLTNAIAAFASFERGDDGQEVMAIQKRLVELSYTITNIDGDFGPETENAVKKFQADRGLEVDGVIGPDTYRALMNRDIPPNRGRSSIVRRVLSAAYSVIGTPYVLAVLPLMDLTVPDLLSMLLHRLVFPFPEQQTASCIMDVKFPWIICV